MNDPERVLRMTLTAARAEHARWGRVIEILETALGDPTFRQTELQIAHGAGRERNGKRTQLSGPGMASLILKEAGRPLHIKRIVAEMDQRGFEVGDQKKYASGLYSNLIRQKKRFRRTGRGTFALVEEEKS